jgi:hypothetical protein
MEVNLETVFKKYLPDGTFYENSTANKIFYQLYSNHRDSEELLKNIIDDLIIYDLHIDDWLLYRLSKDLSISTLEYLSHKGFDVTLADDKGENILFKIFEQTSFNFCDANFDVFKSSFERLVNLGLDFRVINNHGRNLIHQAVDYGVDESLLKYFVSLDIDINKQDNAGFTPLHLASKSCTAFALTTIEILLDSGASKSKYVKTTSWNYDTIDDTLPNGLTPLQIFEIEKNGFPDRHQYENEISEKLK